MPEMYQHSGSGMPNWKEDDVMLHLIHAVRMDMLDRVSQWQFTAADQRQALPIAVTLGLEARDRP